VRGPTRADDSSKAWRAAALAYVKGLVRQPGRLLERIVPARGLVIARALGCETDQQIHVFRRACGQEIAAASAPVLRGLAAQMRFIQTLSDGERPRCRERPWPHCYVPPHGECEAQHVVVFGEARADAPVIAIIERDDWQSQSFYRAPVDRRIARLLAEQAAGACAAPVTSPAPAR
jgi:hypothetical protein